ncbi:phosphoenolpyruvate--protein phosphotransferase [Nocardia sp. NPDC050630]|uniref:phosphoenolpyruvate--protein phosphotransferase n=1 Tax=Nocardia sp. NPDC050630 TaxID=3364321 RepID=UPI00379BAD78
MSDTRKGFGVSRGVTVGPVARMAAPTVVTPESDHSGDGTPAERSAAAAAALSSVADMLDERAGQAGSDSADVLAALAMMVRDPALLSAVDSAVGSGASAAVAITTAFGSFRAMLEAAGPYFAERVSDLDDLRDRAVAKVLGLPMPGIPDPGHPFVLVAHDLAPADTAVLDPAKVLAIVTETGGPSSHTAILAKSLGIPAVVSVGEGITLTDEDVVLVDGTAGTVQISPSNDEIERALTQYRAEVEVARRASGPGRTTDGTPVKLMVNIGASRDLETAAAADSEGVGLFRTEFLFLERVTAPTQAEQIAVYTEVFNAFAGRRVVVRTLDAGADKPLEFAQHGQEPNPALGIRGLRTSRFNPGLLGDQLDAIAAAASKCSADVWVMAPMVSVAAEIREFAGKAHTAGLPVAGAMIEVPAAALRASAILEHGDFVSIGTNDLAQYTFAADRMLGAVGDLLDPWHPALLELIRITASAGHAVGKPVAVCGEAASDPELAPVLVGLGVRSLSMAPSAIPAVRTALLRYPIEALEDAAALALGAEDGSLARSAALSRLGRDRAPIA